MNAYRLYLVTDDQQDLPTLKHVVRKAVEGGVTMVQVREKHGDVRAFIERAQAVKTILEGTGVPLSSMIVLMLPLPSMPMVFTSGSQTCQQRSLVN